MDWYPWGDEAFQKAKNEDKPIFLSIGYSTCHWCHVMAEESFEDKEIAEILNKNYIAIKVDREERPDIDQTYMAVCQFFTGKGGWPLSVFLTPEKKPFFAGTYFPKTNRWGMTGLVEILNQIILIWKNNREEIQKSAGIITEAIHKAFHFQPAIGRQLDETTLVFAFEQLVNQFDYHWGGFLPAPKFPTPHQLTFLLRWFKRSKNPLALKMVKKTLNQMSKGGIFDQIGFGFHRYSVDENWLVPHFEKMLYDQALLSIAYLETFQLTQDINFKNISEEIFLYVFRELTSPEGGFYSAEDADSEGKEGRFYLWTFDEIIRILGKEIGELFCSFYNITPQGNFESGLNLPHKTIATQTWAEQKKMSSQEFEEILEQSRKTLFAVREKRIHPFKDKKILTSWNGLMIAAYAKGYQVLGDSKYLVAAQKATQFIFEKLISCNRRILRYYHEKPGDYPGFLDDYAFLVWGLIELYEATFEIDYLEKAIIINETMIDLFGDEAGEGFFYTEKDNETLLLRNKEVYDGAIPSGNSVAAMNILRLSRMTGNTDLEKMGERIFYAFSSQIVKHPIGSTYFLQALDFALGPFQRIVIVSEEKDETTMEIIKLLQKKFLPNKVVLLQTRDWEEKQIQKVSSFITSGIAFEPKPLVYICDQFSCKKPITDIKELERVINEC